MDSIRILAATDVSPQRLHAAFADAFSDYLIGPFSVALEHWPLFLGRQAVDLSASRVAFAGDDIAAFAFVARREELGLWRLATMGSPPAMRGSGAARVLLDDFIARAGEAGMRGVELECFAQNERALRLYRGRGFEAISPLYGYARSAGDAGMAGGGQPVPLEDAFAWLDAASRERRDLPLQVTPVSLRALAAKLQARALGAARIVFSENSSGLVTVNSLVDRDPSQQDAQALVRGLLREFADRTFSVPQLQRPDVGGQALERLGFEPLPLHQLLMRRPL